MSDAMQGKKLVKLFARIEEAKPGTDLEVRVTHELKAEVAKLYEQVTKVKIETKAEGK